MTQGLPLNQGIGVQCLTCLCPLEVTQEYGADVRRCPRCGGLWMGRRGMHRLRADLHQQRIDTGLTWEALGALLDHERRSTLTKSPNHHERSAR